MRLSPRHIKDVPVLVDTIWLLARVALLRLLLPLPALVRRLDSARAEPSTAVTPEEIHRRVRLTRKILRVLYGSHYCIQQTLVLFCFLRRHGLQAQVQIGVMRRAQALVGHAWIDLDGRPVAQARDPHLLYKTTFTYPPAGGPPDQQPNR